MQAIEQNLADAVINYHNALEECKDDPSSMASFCTASSDTLDTLYASMIQAARQFKEEQN